MNFFDKIADKLFMKQWNIGLARINITELINKKNFSPDYKWLPIKAPDRFFADPFIFKTEDGNINVIYEDFSAADQYGKISLTIVNDKFQPVFTKEMLDTRSHLSYPNVFTENGKIYIIPEASKSGNVTCYEYDSKTRSLVHGKNILENLPLLDSTILVHDNKYWLFATKRGSNSNNKLYIYYAHSLAGPYFSHSGNPVKDSLYGTRPAGNFIKVNGDIYRPSQNCAGYYGKSVILNKIVLLNDREFSEEAVLEISPPSASGFNYGIHTINVLDDVIVIDALKRIFMPVEQVKIFIKKMFIKKATPNVLAGFLVLRLLTELTYETTFFCL